MYYIVLLCLLIVWFRMHQLVKKNKVTFLNVFHNYILLVFILVVLIGVKIFNFPYISNKGIVSFVSTIILLYIFYMLFLLAIGLANLSTKVDKLIRELSIKEKNNEDK